MVLFQLYGEEREMPDTPAFTAYLDPADAVIVSIDLHEGHLSDSPDCPCPAPRAREIVRAVDAFHDAARDLGVPVVHVRSELRPSGADDVKGVPSAWRLGFAEWVGGIPNADQHALAGTPWTAFRTRVEPADEVVTSKKRLSAFYPTDLDFLLRQMGARTVVLDGCMTDCCVLNTAFDASNRNYRVVTVADLVRGTNPELETAALKIMSLNTGVVMRAAELMAAWADRCGTVAPRARGAVPSAR